MSASARSWVHDATCGRAGVDVFFDEATEAAALEICDRCPVVAACLAAERREFLDAGAELDTVVGVRAGLTAPRRRELFAPAASAREQRVLSDVSMTVAERARQLGVSKRTLQRRLSAQRAA